MKLKGFFIPNQKKNVKDENPRFGNVILAKFMFHDDYALVIIKLETRLKCHIVIERRMNLYRRSLRLKLSDRNEVKCQQPIVWARQPLKSKEASGMIGKAGRDDLYLTRNCVSVLTQRRHTMQDVINFTLLLEDELKVVCTYVNDDDE